MKLRQFALIGLSALCLGSIAGPALAQQADCPMAGHGRFHFQERMEKRQSQLHDQLKLSPEQEPAWKTFTAQAKPLQAAERPDFAAWAKLSAPERAERALGQMKEHESRMAQHVEALKTFYGTLNAEQKKTFDQHFLSGMGEFRHGAMGGNKGPGRRHGMGANAMPQEAAPAK